MTNSEVSPSEDDLDANRRDIFTALGRSAAATIPFAGGAISEIITATIPGQRADRIVTYLRLLSDKFEAFEEETKKELLGNSEKIALIEEGGIQAARSSNEDRIARIVEAVSNGLSRDTSEVVRRRRLLRTFGDLDEDEVNILRAYGAAYGGADRRAMADINRPGPPTLKADLSVIEENQLFELGQNRLVDLKLLRKRFPHLKKAQLPEFDPGKGDFKHSLEISHLGRMLLSEIGLKTLFDQAQETRAGQ